MVFFSVMKLLEFNTALLLSIYYNPENTCGRKLMKGNMLDISVGTAGLTQS